MIDSISLCDTCQSDSSCVWGPTKLTPPDIKIIRIVNFTRPPNPCMFDSILPCDPYRNHSNCNCTPTQLIPPSLQIFIKLIPYGLQIYESSAPSYLATPRDNSDWIWTPTKLTPAGSNTYYSKSTWPPRIHALFTPSYFAAPATTIPIAFEL